jgi:uncharacterized protein (TIGR02996 family)
MRTFEFREGTSDKVWTIDLQGTSFTVTWGKRGAKLQTQTKTFADEAKALKEHDKLIAEKISKGYVETTPAGAGAVAPAAGGGAPKPTPLSGALEQALADNPDDLAAHAAYADHLNERGDPRGELIQVQLALEDESKPAAERQRLQAREKQLLDAHQRQWLGGLARYFLDMPDLSDWQKQHGLYNRLRFARGWIDALHIYQLSKGLAKAFRVSPLLRLLRELTVESTYDEDADEDVLPRLLLDPERLRNVRHFRLGPLPPESCHIGGEDAVNFVRLMPRLEELYLYTHRTPTDQLFAQPMPTLRVLHVYHIYAYPLHILAQNATLRNLQVLSLWPHGLDGDHAYISAEEFRHLVASPHLKGLTHLEVHLSDLGDDGCAALVRSGKLKQLKVLDLSRGRITDAGARLLAACPDLKKLERLDLSQNALTAAGVAALQAAGVNLVAGNQYTAAQIQGLEYLYEGDPE